MTSTPRGYELLILSNVVLSKRKTGNAGVGPNTRTTMKRAISLFIFAWNVTALIAFVLPRQPILGAIGSNHRIRQPQPGLTFAHAAQASSNELELSSQEQKVYDIVCDIHDSELPFRIVVVGNGAILETTSQLGPVCKVNKSPKTGEPLCTFASDDQSFEFHLKLKQVSKINLTEKEGPNGSMQILRFLDSADGAMCSLICGKSGGAVEWFGNMLSKYGTEVRL